MCQKRRWLHYEAVKKLIVISRPAYISSDYFLQSNETEQERLQRRARERESEQEEWREIKDRDRLKDTWAKARYMR